MAQIRRPNPALTLADEAPPHSLHVVITANGESDYVPLPAGLWRITVVGTGADGDFGGASCALKFKTHPEGEPVTAKDTEGAAIVFTEPDFYYSLGAGYAGFTVSSFDDDINAYFQYAGN